MQIDFAEIRATPIESVLRKYGVEFRQQSGMLVAKQCPLPSHHSKDLYTFKASIRENLWTCHSTSCKKTSGKNGGDVIDLVCLLDGVAAKEAAERLGGYQNGPRGAERNGGDASNLAPHKNKPLGFVLQANPEHPMIQERGISVETARLYGIGYYRSKQGTASMDDRIIFPLHENNSLVGYIGRTCREVSESNPKWKMGKGVVKSMLFGLDRCTADDAVVLVESPWAVLWLRERGTQAAALLGKELTEGQEKAIAPFRMLSLGLDYDDAGREATEKIAARLRASHAVKRSYFRE